MDPDLEVREGWVGWERTRVRVGKEVSPTKQTGDLDLLGPLSQIVKEKEWTPPPPPLTPCGMVNTATGWQYK